ncbi:hypothetical protein [Nocardia arizonensis]|uniref:hypothetical protein n=1 Tax=Nocardia arizonensis TaxID=1141647 RepID=UPI0006D0BC1D|nr:hypothetical protein [Nocardia arizonensis]
MRTIVGVVAAVAVAGVLGGADAARAAPPDAAPKCRIQAHRWQFLTDAVFDGSGFVLADGAARAAADRDRIPVADLPANRLIVGAGQSPRAIASPLLVITVAGVRGVTHVADVSCAVPDANGR